MGYSRQDYGDYGAESQGNSCYKTPLSTTYLGRQEEAETFGWTTDIG